MTLSTQHMRACLQTFDFKQLFVEELGWNNYSARIAPADVDGVRCTFTPIAEQGGMVVVTCTADDGNIPPSGARRKIDQHVTDLAFEHLIIFLDRDSKGTAQTSLWWWVKREDGTTKPRMFTYRRGMMGDALLQKLAGIAFAIEDLDDEGQVSIATVTSRVKKSFDVETVTKKFYDQFKTEHTAFLKFLTGLPDGQPRDWYASVMLNRLMFLYFIQKKRFLDDDPDYLRTKLEAIRGAGQNFYRDFLVILFFDGLACEEGERDDATNRLLGKIPYLNGGLFLPHSLEDQYGEQIAIADEAFERLFNFFDGYTWHLDERPLRQGNEINPDVLGYIFEKYINQKQMGAYYTKEDITGYICRSTILPFLLDKVGVDVRALLTDVEPYIYEAVSTEDYLPTETEREYAARRARYAQIKADFAAGKIATVDDLVTYNLDIQALVEDWLRGLSDPVLLRRFYFECLLKLTVLDPTAGSGAFLFAAINILEPLYELALDKMRQIVGAPDDAPTRPIPHQNVVKYLDFVDELKRVSAHPNRRYFVLKSIIINNLYGVDIMDEATEICKLRLFLKMVAQVDDSAHIEPLPDIDFNIRAGNTLVGFATRDEIERPSQGGFRVSNLAELMRQVDDADRAMHNFRDLQTRIGVGAETFKSAKRSIQSQLTSIRSQLNLALMSDYGQSDSSAFVETHKPFHWYVEFNGVLSRGGFDIVVGNPPWVEYSSVRKTYIVQGYVTERSGNLHAFTTERAMTLCRDGGIVSFIVQLPLASSSRMRSTREFLVSKSGELNVMTFDDRPGKLFDGLQHCRSTIFVAKKRRSTQSVCQLSVSQYQRWLTESRSTLFDLMRLTELEGSPLHSDLFPKIASTTHQDIFRKVSSQSIKLGTVLKRSPTSNFIFYQEATQYWVKALTQLPHYAKNGVVGAPAHGRYLYFPDTQTAQVASAVLNSSLFYLYFVTYGDCFHLSDTLVSGYPVPIELLKSSEIATLNARLMTDLAANASRKVIRTSTGESIEYDEYSGVKSKPIIDEIDRVLARHYGFTEAELDFIIHYDIKYRMGRDADTEGDTEDE